jgi:hypothetical protein
MGSRIQLRRYNVNTIVWDKILKEYSSELVYTDNIYDKLYGYSDKRKIYLNDEWLIIQEFRFNYICKEIYNKDIIDAPTIWKQIALRLDDTVDEPIKQITGTYAYNYMITLFKKDYTEQEIEDILNSHVAEYDKSLAQYHKDYNTPLKNTIIKFNHVYKYDIHKAHASVLMTMFPKSKNRILTILRKADRAKAAGNEALAKNYKDYPNLTVGMLARKGYKKTYNYIVQTITKKLLSTIEKVEGLNGQTIYSNTDSFAVIYPDNILPDSKEFGEFGLEYEGPAYVCKGDNYTIYKFGDDLKGSCKKIVRDQFDFENGIIVHYKQNRYLIGIDKDNKKHYRTEITDICTEKVNVVEL